MDLVGSGAWPFSFGGVICLVNSDNEREHVLEKVPLRYS